MIITPHANNSGNDLQGFWNALIAEIQHYEVDDPGVTLMLGEEGYIENSHQSYLLNGKIEHDGSDGHLLIYGVYGNNAGIPGGYFNFGGPPYETPEDFKTNSQNDAAFVPHPLHDVNKGNGMQPSARATFFENSSLVGQKTVAGLEVITGDDPLNMSESAMALWDSYMLNYGEIIYGVANSDSHQTYASYLKDKKKADNTFIGINKDYVFLSDSLSSSRSDIEVSPAAACVVTQAFCNGTLSAGRGNTFITMYAFVNGKRYLPGGDVIPIDKDTAVTIVIEISGPEQALSNIELELGDVEHKRIGPVPLTIDGPYLIYQFKYDPAKQGGDFYLRAQVIYDGNLDFSNPVFFEIPGYTPPALSAGVGFGSYAGKDSYSNQVTVATGSSALDNVYVSTTQFSNATGASLPVGVLTVQSGASSLQANQIEVLDVLATIPEGTPEGSYQGTVEVTGIRADTGEVVIVSVSLTIVVDRTTPTTPVLRQPAQADLYSAPFLLSGTLDPDTSFEILVDGTVGAIGTSADDGSLSAEVSLSIGTHWITIRIRVEPLMQSR